LVQQPAPERVVQGPPDILVESLVVAQRRRSVPCHVIEISHIVERREGEGRARVGCMGQAIAPHPVAQATAYQQSLLAAIRADDPAEVKEQGAANVRAMLAAAGPFLRVRPAPREWSPLLCLAHIADAEMVMTGRYRWVLAHDRPELVGYDQDLWVDNLH